jgi:4a-hydroxytetrahydrobiopterin dehydratase
MTSIEKKAIDVFTEAQIATRLQHELPRWSFTNGHIERVFKTAGWKASLMAVNAVGHLAEAAWHHPDLAVSYASVTVRLMTHDAGGITDKDFELARKIEEVVMWRPGRQPGSALEGTPGDERYAYVIGE